MATLNAKFDSIVNFIKEANEKNSKIKSKIKFQVEEINKTKAIIHQFEECLQQQNEMLDKLLDEKLTIKNYKNDLINELSKVENSDDDEYEINFNAYRDKDDSFVEIDAANIDKRNDSSENTYQISLDNCIKVGYYEPRKIKLDKSMDENHCQTNMNMENNYNIEPIKIDFESPEIIGNALIQSNNNQSIEIDFFIPSKNNNRKFIILQAKRKVPENDTSIFKDEDFIKKYSAKLMLRLNNEFVVEMFAEKNCLYTCCEKGILLIYDNMIKNVWKKMYTGGSKNILNYAKFKNAHYLFCENEFVIFNESKTQVKEFNSNIISNIRSLHRKSPFCYISLENGEIWKYDIKNEKFDKIFSFHSQMKTCINLRNTTSLFLTEDGKVSIAYYPNFKEIPKLDGCDEILASILSIVVCKFGNGVCKIYDAATKRLIELEISETIKFARHSRSFLSVLDVQNRLHLYKFTKTAFKYEKTQEIQIPTNRNISAMSSVNKKQVFFTVENAIYSIRIN